MGDELAYEESEARREADICRTLSMVERRRRVREVLGLGPGEGVLSIGCGPGFEPAELGTALGTSGDILGVDRSRAMLALARERCADHSGVSLARGDATELPIPDGAFDAATAVQVYEYVDELDRALSELRRVLRSGGRAVVYDTDFDSIVWRSPNPERMERVLDAWDDHCARPRLGSQLAPPLRDAGFTVDRVEPYTIVNSSLKDDTFLRHFADFLAEWTAEHDDIGPEMADDWAEDLRRCEDAGGTFFSLTQYLYLVRAPRE